MARSTHRTVPGRYRSVHGRHAESIRDLRSGVESMNQRWRSTAYAWVVCVCVFGCARAPSAPDAAQAPRTVAEPKPASVSDRLTRALRHEAGGNFTQAASELMLALAQAPDDWRTLLALARVHWLQGHMVVAREFGSKATESFEHQHREQVRLVRASVHRIAAADWLDADWLGLRQSFGGPMQFWVWSSGVKRRSFGIDLDHSVRVVNDPSRLVLEEDYGGLGWLDLAQVESGWFSAVRNLSASTAISPNLRWLAEEVGDGLVIRALDDKGEQLALPAPSTPLPGPTCVAAPGFGPYDCPRFSTYPVFSPTSQHVLLASKNGLRQFALPTGELLAEWALRADEIDYRQDGRAGLVVPSDQERAFYHLDLDTGRMVSESTGVRPADA